MMKLSERIRTKRRERTVHNEATVKPEDMSVMLRVTTVDEWIDKVAQLEAENDLIFKLLPPDTALWLRRKLDALKEGG